uniref:Regulatory protein E2 n=1 Tax=Human papillomavirus TaxID=10566 RepID=A0A385PJC6_9PAPI|nr:MAG: E2 protein [Human papillomavirus]
METQQSLAERFAAQQEMQMTLIEKESTDLSDHIAYWDAVRLENLLGFYARKEGFKQLGLQPLPTLLVLEYKCKEAMKMKLLLESLSKSQYADEPWTLSEVSAELMNTNPKNCFKKRPFTVTVYFDNDEQNSYPYICWEYIYYQDDKNMWHKVNGDVDINGLFFREVTGDFTYFTLFQPDAEKYGHTGHWSVKFNNQTLFTSVTSSTRTATGSETRAPTHPVSVPKTTRKRKQQSDTDSESQSPTSTSSGLRFRRGRQQGESATDGGSAGPPARTRRRGADTGAPSPEEVGSRTETLPRQGLPRIRRLQEEARDPYLVCFQGCQNSLKCFRYRCFLKYPQLYIAATNVFQWIYHNNEKSGVGRMLFAFSSHAQREEFMQTVTVPKGCNYCYGNIDCL